LTWSVLLTGDNAGVADSSAGNASCAIWSNLPLLQNGDIVEKTARERRKCFAHRGKIGQSPCQSEPSCLFRYPILGEQKAGAERETQA
jgi:hypothetical protein